MSLKDEIINYINEIATVRWSDIPNGRVVPQPEDLGLGNKGILLDATILYADLKDSTTLAMYDQKITAEVCKAFLGFCTKIIISEGGVIRSFDGDRVMGIFIGDYKNTSAVKAALKIKYIFIEFLKPKFSDVYKVFKSNPDMLSYSVGIDTSSVLVVRSGIKNSNDLIWVGRSPNIAAKLSTIREHNFNTFITSSVYNSIHESAKLSNGVNMWQFHVSENLPSEISSIYKSTYYWRL